MRLLDNKKKYHFEKLQKQHWKVEIFSITFSVKFSDLLSNIASMTTYLIVHVGLRKTFLITDIDFVLLIISLGFAWISGPWLTWGIAEGRLHLSLVLKSLTLLESKWHSPLWSLSLSPNRWGSKSKRFCFFFRSSSKFLNRRIIHFISLKSCIQSSNFLSKYMLCTLALQNHYNILSYLFIICHHGPNVMYDKFGILQSLSTVQKQFLEAAEKTENILNKTSRWN